MAPAEPLNCQMVQNGTVLPSPTAGHSQWEQRSPILKTLQNPPEQNRKAQLAETYQISAPTPFLFTHHTAHSFIFLHRTTFALFSGFPPSVLPREHPHGAVLPCPSTLPWGDPAPSSPLEGKQLLLCCSGLVLLLLLF